VPQGRLAERCRVSQARLGKYWLSVPKDVTPAKERRAAQNRWVIWLPDRKSCSRERLAGLTLNLHGVGTSTAGMVLCAQVHFRLSFALLPADYVPLARPTSTSDQFRDRGTVRPT
jgi:hypothetical protein